MTTPQPVITTPQPVITTPQPVITTPQPETAIKTIQSTPAPFSLIKENVTYAAKYKSGSFLDVEVL